jgi:UDP-N-acetylmuramyl pentapeptide phosphotransferase/UDP-N-acetylglucosamine-1-phosphate transferase
MVSGHTHAMNIVDGLNGLAGGIAVLGLVATAFVCWRLGDAVLVNVCVVLVLSVAGFLVVNFPHGRLFMGDGGAYFLGFAMVQVWLLLLSRHPEVSPWFVVAVAFHPTMETVFSIYRRRLQRSRQGAVMSADRLHLHSLLYRRKVVPFSRRRPGLPLWAPNAMAALAVAGFAAVPMAAATAAPLNGVWCFVAVCAAAVAYVYWFRQLVLMRPSTRARPRTHGWAADTAVPPAAQKFP